MALFAHDIDRMQCATPGCDHADHRELVFHGRCHLGSPTWTAYDRLTKTVKVTCAECGQLVVEIAVAGG